MEEWSGQERVHQLAIGLGGKSNERVSGLIQQTPYSIGYVELMYAVQTDLNFEGRTQPVTSLKGNLATVTEAAAGAARFGWMGLSAGGRSRWSAHLHELPRERQAGRIRRRTRRPRRHAAWLPVNGSFRDGSSPTRVESTGLAVPVARPLGE